MLETAKEVPDAEAEAALGELMENVARFGDGVSDMMACALRMQMLVLEDARNMLTELGAAAEAASRRNDDG